MTTVATISASAPSGAAGFTGPARSSETSDQFAIELGKTTQQVRERGNTAEPRPNPPKGSADNAASTPVENATGNEVASGTEATQQGEQVEPQQLLDSVIAGLDNGESTDLNHDQSTDLQSLVSTPIVAIAPLMVLPAEQLVAMDETAAAVAPVPVLPKAVVSSPVTLAAAVNADVLPIDSVDPLATTPVATLGVATELSASQTATPAPLVSPDNLTSDSITPMSVTPVPVTPLNVSPEISTPVTIAPVTLTPNNLTPEILTPGTLTPVTVTPGNLSAPPSEVVSPTAQLQPSIVTPVATPVESASPLQPTATRTSPVGEGAPVGTPASAASSAPGATVQVVANQGGDSQQSPEPSGSGGSEPVESSVVDRDPDQLSDELAKVESGATGRMQVADAAQGVDPRVTTAGSNPVATTAPTPVAFESNSPVTVVEPKAPTPIPVSTQMSAHLSAFRGLADGTYETTIRLNPEELGQVSVRIQVNGGTVSIHAFGASDIAVQALREAMPDLRQDLLRSGLDLVDSQVDQGSASFGNEREAASGRPLDTDKTDVSAENLISRPTGADVDAISDMNRSEGGLVDVRV